MAKNIREAMKNSGKRKSMSDEKLKTLMQMGRINNIKKNRKLTDTERLEYKALMETIPKD